jgi:nitrate/nitrite-specific signal transduction histidine kinase
MSKRLEDFIKTNSAEFDDLEPGNDLWDKIEKKLPQEVQQKREAKTFTLGFVMRVAAIVIMVMAVSFVFYLKSEKPAGVNLADISPEYAQQQVHYASLVESKRTELKNLTKNDPQLYTEFSGEIAKMDSTYKKLNSDLATSPNQERVLHAMIRNLQIQTEVLNQQLQVIEQFNQMKKEQSHGTKDI